MDTGNGVLRIIGSFWFLRILFGFFGQRIKRVVFFGYWILFLDLDFGFGFGFGFSKRYWILLLLVFRSNWILLAANCYTKKGSFRGVENSTRRHCGVIEKKGFNVEFYLHL